MPKIAYIKKRMRAETLAVVHQANAILNKYAAMGYDLTLRQLYYQFVSRALIANNQAEYNRLGNIVNDARMAGMIDWEHIVDRTRNLRDLPTWDTPALAIKDWTKRYFQIDKWKDQPYHVEVWIEKDALVGVIERPCYELDVPFFSCRGYTSQSEMWTTGQRLVKMLHDGKDVRILHLGDHDPSGIDMTRDIEERLTRFIASHGYWGEIDSTFSTTDGNIVFAQTRERFSVDRIALNMDQVDEYNPPPNPAKISDSRAAQYIAEYGDESWELDALPPDVLGSLITEAVEGYLDHDKWADAEQLENEYVKQLTKAADNWGMVTKFAKGLK